MEMENDVSVDRRVPRVNHVSFVYATPEHQEAARDEFTSLLGISDWDEVLAPDRGIRVFMSWDSGLELMCATRPGSILEEYLERHGEGFYSLVMAVRDMDESLRRLKEHGRDPVYVRSPTYGHVLERFDSFRSALLGDVAGIRLVLGEYRPKVSE
jgi:Glyoxalase/Bleomycin resistance protein/Dioxygenase superfamily